MTGPCVLCRRDADPEGSLCPRCTATVYPPIRAQVAPIHRGAGAALLDPLAAPVYGTDPAHVRSWARRVGIEVGRRGRIPRHVLEAYHAQVAPNHHLQVEGAR